MASDVQESRDHYIYGSQGALKLQAGNRWLSKWYNDYLIRKDKVLQEVTFDFGFVGVAEC